MSVLLIATVPIAAMDDADVINIHRYCAHSKMKCHTSLEWMPTTPYKLESPRPIFFLRNQEHNGFHRQQAEVCQ
jgi:hypothetical protein